MPGSRQTSIITGIVRELAGGPAQVRSAIQQKDDRGEARHAVGGIVIDLTIRT